MMPSVTEANSTVLGARAAPVRIAVVCPPSSFGRSLLLGMAAEAYAQGILLSHWDPTYRPLQDVRQRNAQGVVVTLFHEGIADEVRPWGLPTINISSRMECSEFPQVIPDNREVGALGARHLLEQNLSHYAFAGQGGHQYSASRLEGFRQVLGENGHQPYVHLGDRSGELDPSRRWLASLPKPVGLMACNDQRACGVLEQLAQQGIRVPQDVRLVGVDNDEVLCLMSNPRLSSIDCAQERVGRVAIRLMKQWLTTGTRPPARTLVPPLGCIVRQSSDLLATNDPLVARALDLIRARARSGLSVENLLDEMMVSRRNLELHFRKALGSTPAAEIVRTQVRAACQLLADTEMDLDAIAQSAGLGYQRQLRLAMRREMGVTPTAYRRKFRQGG